MQNQIAVVGGCNIDISATSYTFLIEADSNPGYVKTTLGGVGRNIAENLLLLGYPVSMITPLSRDSFLSQILSHSVEIGLDLSHSVYFDDVPNSVYLCINHPNGDEACVLPPMAHDGVNYSGCGDAFFAGVLHGLINRKSTSATLRCGLAMSALSAFSPCAVSPDVSAEALEQILSETKEEK